MRFWDTSALVPLYVREAGTERMRALHREDSAVSVWWGSRVECVSAVVRRVREGQLDEAAERQVRADLRSLFEVVSEVAPTEEVRERAERCLATHALRAADALQLGAALIWARERPAGMGFVSLDERLRAAAMREGFDVLPADEAGA
ncbi:MAG: type II toxin-antitoxin system VapC family toxin [Chloroflexota bacterium]